MLSRRYSTSLLVIFALATVFGLSFVLNSAGRSATLEVPQIQTSDNILHGTAQAPKLENATLKAELGHAAWKVLHTTMAKFPDKPTGEDSAALKSYIYLFARLYPCGDCARHFQQILSQFPPQVGSRSSAAAWACHVHNEVNKSLKKDLFDCTKIGDFYDCGCAADGPGATTGVRAKADQFKPLELQKEGPTRGG